jgi:integrase
MATVRKRTWVSGGVTHFAWQASYTDGEGKRRTRTFETKKAALAALVDIQGEVRDGKHTPLPKTITLREAGDLWIARGVNEGWSGRPCRITSRPCGCTSTPPSAASSSPP